MQPTREPRIISAQDDGTAPARVAAGRAFVLHGVSDFTTAFRGPRVRWIGREQPQSALVSGLAGVRSAYTSAQGRRHGACARMWCGFRAATENRTCGRGDGPARRTAMRRRLRQQKHGHGRRDHHGVEHRPRPVAARALSAFSSPVPPLRSREARSSLRRSRAVCRAAAQARGGAGHSYANKNSRKGKEYLP
jgi:hypothetical protein